MASCSDAHYFTLVLDGRFVIAGRFELNDTIPKILQELPPRSARLCLAVERFLTGELEFKAAGKKILIAFSHGLDSTALLLILYYLQHRLNNSLAAALLDHGLRDESASEAECAARLCESLGIPFFTEKIDVAELAKASKIGLEEAGRNARRGFLEKVRKERGCDFIAFGHQLNDLAEDIVMRLIRGAAWPGLGGMRGIDPENRIIRPILLTGRDDLRDFLLSINAPWQEDPSNHDQSFFRNRVRDSVLPLFLRENPNFLQKAAELWRTANRERAGAKGENKMLADTLASLAAPEYGFSLPASPSAVPEDSLFLPNGKLSLPGKSVRLELYKAILEKLGRGQIRNELLLRLDELVFANTFPAKIVFPGAKTALVTAKGILFYRQAPIDAAATAIDSDCGQG